MNEVLAFLKKVGTFYVATVDNLENNSENNAENNSESKSVSIPRVRPFGVASLQKGRIYLVTGNYKNFWKQIKENPRVEISATDENGVWIRLTASIGFDDDDSVKTAILEENPNLKAIYAVGDGKFEAFYLKNASGTFNSLSGEFPPNFPNNFPPQFPKEFEF